LQLSLWPLAVKKKSQLRLLPQSLHQHQLLMHQHQLLTQPLQQRLLLLIPQLLLLQPPSNSSPLPKSRSSERLFFAFVFLSSRGGNLSC
jgi:hypothetical protein